MAAPRKIIPLIALVLGLSMGPAQLLAQPGEGPVVSSIEAEGLYRIPRSTVVKRINTKEGQAFSPFVLSEDIKRLHKSGYFDDIRVFARETDNGLVLKFIFRELPRVQKIEFSGNDEIEEDDLKKVITVKTARFLNLDDIEKSILAIKDSYRDKGFYRAEISYKLTELSNNRVDVTFTIQENSKIKVTRIEIVGNHAVPESDIKDFMQTGEAGYFSFMTPHLDTFKEEIFDLDLRRVQWVYLTKGFLDVKVGTPIVELATNMEEVSLTVPVEEGQMYEVGDVSIITTDADGLIFEMEDLEKRLQLRKGDIFNMEMVQKDTQALSTKYMDIGFAHANVGSQNKMNRDSRIVDFTYVIQKGNPTYIRNIRMSGNTTTRDKVIRRMMKISEGDLYNQTNIKLSEALIFRLGFLKDVSITSRDVEAPDVAGDRLQDVDYVDLVVSMEEQDTGAMQLGAGFSSMESFLFQGRLSKNNFLGRGQTFSLQVMLSSLRQIYMISFSEPYFMDTNWNFSINLYNMQTIYEAFETTSIGGDLSWGYRFLEDYLVFLTYKLEHKDASIGGSKGYTPVPIERMDSGGLTSSVRLSLAWDTRNNRIIPTSGFYNSFSVEHANPYFGSDTNFSRFILNSRWYIPLKWDFILRMNGTLGWVTGGGDRGIPIYERFFVGGIFSVRGFSRNSLSPVTYVASANDPGTSLTTFSIGGNKEAIFNLELEVPIVKSMRIMGVLFFDAGNAYDNDENMSLSGLRTSVGVGIRWWSQMGPLRFEWGFPLDPRKGEEPMVFEFTIGSSF